jgi:hypothetical protein
MPLTTPSRFPDFQKMPRMIAGKKLDAASPNAKRDDLGHEPGRIDAEVAGAA